jgi:ferredoxin
VSYVVTELCIGCKHTACVPVCPVDCFREGENFVVIAPDECVDCGLCEIECPLRAIVSESELGEENRHCAQLNAELAQQWPPITQRKPALPDAEHLATVPDKLALLRR